MKADLSKRVDIDGMRSIGVSNDRDNGDMLESVGAPPVGTEWQEIEIGLEGTGAKRIKVLVSKPETFAGDLRTWL